jgi:hypothetical protein
VLCSLLSACSVNQNLVWSIRRDGNHVFLNLNKYGIKCLKVKKAALLRKSVILQLWHSYGCDVTVMVLLSGMCCCMMRSGVQSQLFNHTHLL